MRTGKVRRKGAHTRNTGNARKRLQRPDGLREGWSDGYRLGRCEAIMQQPPSGSEAPLPIKVLYVTAGISGPYPALDKAISEAMGGLVGTFDVSAPDHRAIQTAEQMRPDLVLVLNGVKFPLGLADALRSKGFRTAIWFTDDPYYTDWTAEISRHYDYVFTQELSCVSWYRSLGCEQVHYLPLGFDPSVYQPKRFGLSERTDVCFIGNAFRNRLRLFDQVARSLSGRRVMISGLWWRRLIRYGVLRNKIHQGWLSPVQTASYYNGAKIVINLHRDYDDQALNQNTRKIRALSVNPRTFEIAACGTLQLTDVREDLPRFYTPSADIATFATPKELVDKIAYYLSHEEERRDLALRGFERTIREHTYRKRLSHLLSVVFPPPEST